MTWMIAEGERVMVGDQVEMDGEIDVRTAAAHLTIAVDVNEDIAVEAGADLMKGGRIGFKGVGPGAAAAAGNTG
jgi:hypothetical protein